MSSRRELLWLQQFHTRAVDKRHQTSDIRHKTPDTSLSEKEDETLPRESAGAASGARDKICRRLLYAVTQH